MSTFNLTDSAILTNAVQVALTKDVDITTDQAKYTYEAVIKAMSDFLGQAKSRDHKTAIALNDLKGNLVVAGVVTYHKPETEGAEGNWSYVLTFDPTDLQDAKVHLVTDPHFETVFDKVMRQSYGLAVGYILQLCPTMIELFNVLKHWLDINAKDNEEVELDHPGYFKATVVVENGEKILSITPAGEMKVLIKGDAALEA
ncbi:MAG: hypothetical protein ACRCXT_06170 [Paraclostridium sp.]